MAEQATRAFILKGSVLYLGWIIRIDERRLAMNRHKAKICEGGVRTGRNLYIDGLRGMAALCIIVIHTAFWSGQSYTPEWFWNLTLFIDVPFFFYLSGWGSSYNKPDVVKVGKSLSKIWIEWTFFIVVLTIACPIVSLTGHTVQGVTDVKDLVSNLMFHVSIPGLQVVGGSIWFMQYYIVVILLNTVVLSLNNHNENNNTKRLNVFYMWLLLVSFIWVYYGNYTFGLDIAYFCFYAFFWMLGYNGRLRTDRFWKMILGIVFCGVGIVFTSYLQGLPLHDIQSAKFPPSPKYIFVSLVAIIIFRYLEKFVRRNNRFLIHIGRIALFYFFGQGVSSSLCYYLVAHIDISVWFTKWLVILVLNILMAIAIAETLSFLYNNLRKGIVRLTDYVKGFCTST